VQKEFVSFFIIIYLLVSTEQVRKWKLNKVKI